MFGEQTFAQLRTGFTATEIIRTDRDWEPWTATSTFTQLLSSKRRSFASAISVIYIIHVHVPKAGPAPSDTVQ